MGLRCRAGDMAICNRTVWGVHVGHVVDVIGYAVLDEIVGHKWLVKTRAGEVAKQPDAWMTPIRPDELKEEEEKERELVE